MKKLLFVLLGLIITLSSYAQLDRAYSLQVAKYNKTTGIWVWGDPTDVDLRFTFEGSYIRIHDEYGTRIWTYEDLGETSGYDDDGDSYKKHVWMAYDEKNRKCRFTMLWYTSGVKLVTYTVQYNDYAFRYYISTAPSL